MSNRFPSFQWYPDDWLGSTARATLSPVARAAYLDLLCHYWNGECKGLIQDEKWLRNLAGNNRISKADLQDVIGCFKKKHKKLHHPKLQAIYKERVAYVEGQKEAGKRGAKKRWGTHSDPTPNPTDPPMAKNRSSSPSPSSSLSSSPSPEEDEKEEPPAFKSGTVAAELADAYLRINKGAFVKRAKLIKNIQDRLDAGMSAEAAHARLMDEKACKSMAIWDILDPITPNGQPIPESMGEYRKRKSLETEIKDKFGGENAQI